MEPVAGKWASFGWATQEIDGNDMAVLVAALKRARQGSGKPHAIVLRTTPGFGAPRLMAREKAHFVRVEPDEWDALMAELEA
jgi:transketolase